MPGDRSCTQLTIPGLFPVAVEPDGQVALDLAEASARVETMERLFAEDGRQDPTHPLCCTYTGLGLQPEAEQPEPVPKPATLATRLDVVHLRQCARDRGLEYGAEAVALRREITRLEGLEAACRARYFRELRAAEPIGEGPDPFEALTLSA